jgi:sec-independent protein translocase protein TatA
MGFGNIGWFQILVVLLIVLLIFGTKRIRTLGSDVGGAIREFRKSVSEDDSEEKAGGAEPTADSPDSDKPRKPDSSDPSGR